MDTLNHLPHGACTNGILPGQGRVRKRCALARWLIHEIIQFNSLLIAGPRSGICFEEQEEIIKKMNIQRLLRFTRLEYEKVIKDLITRKNYDVHYSYTNADVYLFGKDAVLDQIQLDSNDLRID